MTEPDLTAEEQAAVEAENARTRTVYEAEAERFADHLVREWPKIHRPVLLPVDETVLQRRYLLVRHHALTRANGRSRECRAVLKAGLDHVDGVSVRELAEEADLPVDVVRIENQALKRMGLARCPKAGSTGTWSYVVVSGAP